jgi:hypothetical protein
VRIEESLASLPSVRRRRVNVKIPQRPYMDRLNKRLDLYQIDL